MKNYKNMTEQELLTRLDKAETKWYKVKQFLLGSIAVCLIVLSGLMTAYLIENHTKTYTINVDVNEHIKEISRNSVGLVG